VLGVVTQGVRDTSMPGWRGTFTADEIRAVSAYVFYLAGRTVPDELRGH
jgi:cytochrome c oxidase cbb3-type subunit 3